MARLKNPTRSNKKPQSYQTLKEVWYRKLERSGFQDIEQDEYRLKGSEYAQTRIFTRGSDWQTSQEYYSMARRFLHDYTFASTLEKVIWEYHANGLSFRSIAKVLRKVKTTRTMNKDSVNQLVSPLVKTMLKMYLVGDK